MPKDNIDRLLNLWSVKKLLIVLLCFFALSNTSYLHASDKGEGEIKDKIENYKKQKDYNYFQQKQQVEKEIEKSNFDFSFLSWIGDAFMTIVVILFVLIVGFIAYSIIKGGNFGSMRDRKISDPVSEMYENVNEEDINSNDFDSLIKRALGNEDFRLVLRLMFLKALQLLDTKKLIAYEKNKTNYDYSFEIKKRTLKNEFLNVSDSFAYIWYGNTSIDKETYEKLNPDFTKFISSIDK